MHTCKHLNFDNHSIAKCGYQSRTTNTGSLVCDNTA